MNRPAIALGLVVLLLWQSLSSLGLLSPNLLPGPLAIGRSLVADQPLWMPHLQTTLLTALAGFALALLLALLLCIAMDRFAWLKRALYPWLLVSQMVPIIFVYPLMLIWLGFGLAAKVAVVTLVCFFPMAVSLSDGLARTPVAWQRMLLSFGASEWQRFRYLRFPAALPATFSGLRISATYCVMGAVLGEWLGARSGLGVYMLRAYKSFNSARVFAAVVLVVGLSLLLVGLIRLAERRWSYTERLSRQAATRSPE